MVHCLTIPKTSPEDIGKWIVTVDCGERLSHPKVFGGALKEAPFAAQKMCLACSDIYRTHFNAPLDDTRETYAVYVLDEGDRAGSTVHVSGCTCGFCKIGNTDV